MAITTSEWLLPVDELLLADRYDDAEKLLNHLVKKKKSEADAHALLATIKLWTQREFESINHLVSATIGRDYAWALDTTVRYFTARKQMALKKGIQDDLGNKALEKLSELEGFEPIEENLIGLSACLIVKNESKNLKRCLQSLVGIANQIVVIDTGSTDDTVKIAKKFGCTVDYFKWIDDFASARNKSLELASQPWILWIDADEELDKSSHTMLDEALMRPQFAGYQIQIINFTDSNNSAQQFVHTPIRLFKNDPKIRFTGKIHEQIVQGIIDLGLKSATLSGVTVNHYGYTAEMISDRDKINRTIKILETEILENPDFSFNWFNLANTYAVARDFQKAADAAQKCINTLPRNATYGQTAYDVLASALVELQDYDRSLDVILEAEKCGQHTVLTEFTRLNALLKSGKIPEAILSGKRCMAMEWAANLTGDFGVFRFKRHIQFARALAQNGQFEEALKLIEESLEANPLNSGAFGIKGAILMKQGQYEAALFALQQCLPFNQMVKSGGVSLGSNQTEALPLIVETALVTGNFELASAAIKVSSVSVLNLESWINAIVSKEKLEALNLLENHFDQAWAKQKLAQAYLTLHQPQIALDLISTTLNQLPEDPVGWFITGDAAYQLGQFLDAAEFYQQGLTIAPEHAEGWFVLGNAMAQMGANQAAINLYSQCLKLEPNHFKAKHNLATISAPEAA